MKNRMAKQKQLGATSLVLTLAALLLVNACAPTSTSPVEEQKVVEIGLIADLTGAASSAVYQPFMVLDNYVRYFDAERGIPEATVRLSWVDSAHMTAKAISAYRSFIERGVPAVVLISAETPTLKPLVAKDEVPLFTFSISETTFYPPGWLYTVYPTDAERFAVVCDWIMENWSDERPPRVAFLGPDAPLGREPQAQGTKYAESLGIVMLPMEFVEYVPLDVSPQLLRLSERGADYVYITGLWTTAIPILRDAARLGLMDKMHFSGYENTQAISMVETLGTSAKGYFAPRVVPFAEEVEVPGVKLLQDLMMEYQGKVQLEGDEGNPMRMGSVICEAIKIAAEEAGYENLDRVALARALEGFSDFDPYGLGPITYTSEDHRGASRTRIYQVEGGEIIPVTNWRECPMLVPEE